MLWRSKWPSSVKKFSEEKERLSQKYFFPQHLHQGNIHVNKKQAIYTDKWLQLGDHMTQNNQNHLLRHRNIYIYSFSRLFCSKRMRFRIFWMKLWMKTVTCHQVCDWSVNSFPSFLVTFSSRKLMWSLSHSEFQKVGFWTELVQELALALMLQRSSFRSRFKSFGG